MRPICPGVALVRLGSRHRRRFGPLVPLIGAALRALGHRGRATFDSWTPEVLVRLFGAPEALRRNNAVRGRTDLPDPVFWRVLEFAFGTVYDYPWVRHRVRARG